MYLALAAGYTQVLVAAGTLEKHIILALAASVAVGVMVFGLVMWITRNDVLLEFERLIGKKRGNKGEP